MSVSFESHVALFGGAFHPPHLGHLRAIEGIKSNPKVKRVIALPTYANPLKGNLLNFSHRFAMTKLALREVAEVSDFEEQHQTEFTWQLLEKMAPQFEKLAFVIGTDQLKQIEKWARFPQVLGLSDWIVLIRKPEKLAHLSEALRHLVNLSVIQTTKDPSEFTIPGITPRILKLVETDAPAVSSTWIREQFALGKKSETKPYLQNDVMTYIERNHLYGN